MPAQPARHGEHRGDDGAARAGQVAAAVDPGRVDAQGLLDRGDAALAHAHADRARVGGEPVDVVEREAGVGDGAEAGVDGQRQRVDHQPPPEGRSADAREHGPVLEAVVARAAGRGAGRVGLGDRVDRIGARRWARRAGSTRRRPARSGPATCWPMCTSSGSHPMMLVVSRTDRVLGQRHDGDHVGRLEAGQPLVLVDGEADRPWRGPTPGSASEARLRQAGQIGTGGCTNVGAVVAALDAELPVGARGPEPRRAGGEGRKRSHGAQKVLRKNSTAPLALGNDPATPDAR